MTSFSILVNPKAGKSTASARGEAVAGLLRTAGSEVRVSVTANSGEARRFAAEAVGRDEVVVVVGGDGTIGAIAGEVIRADGILGLVPSGRGNDFARQLDLPTHLPAVARVLLAGRVRWVDVIEVAPGDASAGMPNLASDLVGDPSGESDPARIVVGSVYAGIDSLTSELVDRAGWLPTVLQYPVAALRAIAIHRSTSYELTIDGASHSVAAHTVVVANAGYYGSGMHVAPGAEVDDGELSVVTVGEAGRLKLLNALRLVYRGDHLRLDEVSVVTARTVTIRAAGAVTAYADGERIGRLPVTARVVPGALRILA